MRNKPNLLFVFPDQWRRQAVGYRGEDPVYTPHIDRFAQESLSLSNAISCFPLCSPNRSSLMTGRYPLSTGVITNCKTGLNIKLNDTEKTIGNVLKDSGYQTGYIGKWHLDVPERNESYNPESGAKHWDAYIPPGSRRFGFDFWHAYNADDNHMDPHYWQDTPEMIKPEQWSLEHETDVAIDYIKQRDPNRPFALVVSWNPPHQPFDQVPDTYRKLYENAEIEYRPNVYGAGVEESDKHLRNYFAAVTGMDEQFGRLLRFLQEEGLEEDTIVVLTSDHGELMGAHEWMEHKNIWYEEAIGVPFMIRWPNRIAAGSDDRLFNSVDVVPTLLGLMNITGHAGIEGLDHSKAFLGSPCAEAEGAFICHYPGPVEEHKEAERLGLDIRAFGWRGVRTKRYTYVVKRMFGSDRAERWLYDLEMDPYQISPQRIQGSPEDCAAVHLEHLLIEQLNRISDPFMMDKEVQWP